MTSATLRRTGALLALLLAVVVVGVPRGGTLLTAEAYALVSPTADSPAVVVADAGHASVGVAVLVGVITGLGWATAWLWVTCGQIGAAGVGITPRERRWRARKVGAPPSGAR